MICALGWCASQDAKSQGVFHQDFDDTAVVLAWIPKPKKHEILRHQMRVAGRMHGFLPASADLARSLNIASNLTRSRPREILQAIKAVSGSCQISIHLQLPMDTSRPYENSSWLRRRAAMVSAQEARIQTVLKSLTALASEICPVDMRHQAPGMTVQFDCLVDKRDVEERLQILGRRLKAQGPHLFAGCRCTLAGPLPVFAFSELTQERSAA